jgi:uncharacterized protein (DUF885 family)
MGGYFTDDEKFGQHVSELTLLVAAAVDTGIYQLGWNAADARKFIAANTPLTAPQTRALLQRINTHPGASTSAIMGNWALEHLREKTKKQLGDDFNIKEFHSALLSFGPVTPKELERLMSGWATQQKIRNSQPLIANEKAIDAIAAPDSSLNDDDEQDEKESSIGELEIKASAP